ncbi:Twitching mobility protein [candidate division SR1 bacterium Aalborg_AAW-1]|nr:Twitching mobility protein [candidate division SR1 bacterium Aalborg_AAW-1]
MLEDTTQAMQSGGASFTENQGSVLSHQQVTTPIQDVRVDITTIIEMANQNEKVSDIHISAGDYLSFRITGDIVKQTQYGKISSEFMELFLKHLMQSDTDRIAKFWSQKDMDFAYLSKDGTTYRVNAFMKLGKVAVVMRKINATARSIESLMYEDIAGSIKKHILSRKTGLFLVCGPTGSGKSTSLVAMLQYLNQTTNAHMITIEDPIEFIFKAEKCLISQRELGGDTWSFINALRSAMREDPNIVFVGEIRDTDTAEAALNLAETGHMVFSTLHTSSAASTINRYLSLFPPEIQSNVSDRLSDSLAGVLSQYLVKSKDEASRIGLYELMINNTAVRNNIKKGDIKGIDNIIETSSSHGMISMKSYAQRLLSQGLISEESVQWLFLNTQQTD